MSIITISNLAIFFDISIYVKPFMHPIFNFYKQLHEIDAENRHMYYSKEI